MFDSMPLPPAVVGGMVDLAWFIGVICILPFILHYVGGLGRPTKNK